MNKMRKGFIAVSVLALTSTAVIAAGNWSTWPVIGGSSYCASFTTFFTGQSCAQTVPQGPSAQTGVEMIPVDTQLPGSAPPQSAVIPMALIGSLNTHTNKIIGGDFATNLWQRGLTPVNAASPTTATMAADRWFAYSASTQVTVSKQTGVTDTIPTSGLYASMRVQRPSSQTGTGAVCVGQVLDKIASAEIIGQNAVFSFSALAGANLSSVNDNLVVTIAYYTAADSATAGTNTATFATATTTGYQAAVAGASNGTTATIASGAATIPLSATWTRYAVYAPIPTVNASGTAVTGVGVTICDTPVGTAGTNDWFEIEGVQLQAVPSTVTGILPAGVISPTGFERRLASIEALYQYYYSFILTEPISPIALTVGSATTSSNCELAYPLPSVMRTAPTFTSGSITSSGTNGNYLVRFQNTRVPVSAIATDGANTINQLSLNVTTTGMTAGNACVLEGNNGTALPVASAEP